jgi:hypothetical protein
MGCKTSKFSVDHEHFHGLRSRPDTPSIYSSYERSVPSHSRNNSHDRGQARPLLRSRFSSTIYGTKKKAPKLRLFPRGDKFDNNHNDPEKIHSFCNHERQRDTPCFACLREKPKPRRHRSHRNAQVMIPRASYYGKRKRRSRSNSFEAPLRPEERPTWVTSRHGIFVPVPVANELNVNINRHQQQSGHSFQSFRPARGHSGSTVVGGYIVSPEVYYSSLPLPDLPQDASDHLPGRRANDRGRLPAWI